MKQLLDLQLLQVLGKKIFLPKWWVNDQWWNSSIAWTIGSNFEKTNQKPERTTSCDMNHEILNWLLGIRKFHGLCFIIPDYNWVVNIIPLCLQQTNKCQLGHCSNWKLFGNPLHDSTSGTTLWSRDFLSTILGHAVTLASKCSTANCSWSTYGVKKAWWSIKIGI